MNATRLHRFVEPTLWLVAAVALTWAVVGWRRAIMPAQHTAAAHHASRIPHPAAWRADSLAEAARAIVRSDPFRLDHRPADVAYHATSDGAPPSPPPAPPKPGLTLAGLIGGPPWTALVDGIPGRTGTVVVHPGDVVGTLTVRTVGRDTVIVRGMDTTWVLTLKHPWR